MRAVNGAIEQLRIGVTKRITWRTIGESHPVGLCGSGLLDTLAELYARGIIDRTGRFKEGSDKRLVEGEEGLQFQLVQPSEGHQEVSITQIDINNLIRSKAGVFSSIRVLLQATNTRPEDIQAVYLAGGVASNGHLRREVAAGAARRFRSRILPARDA